MKQRSDFCFPSFSQSALIEKCLYISPHSDEKNPDSQSIPLFSWNDSSIFMRSQPLIVEYCSGNGQWIAEMAHRFTQFNWIAVERDFDRARKIWLKMFRMQLDNLFVVFGEGLAFSEQYLPSAGVKEVYVNFPDPWPKRRHAKHRIIQKAFVDEMGRILRLDGMITLVTDDVAYSEQISALFAGWKSAWGASDYVTSWPEFGDSFFHSLWKEQQRVIHYHRYYSK